ncbi:MAG TPA: biopolymer transporter ExbD [Phycisphaerales bacterium]|nr:biopolymer transporter ExbD [Phycisphaerales bacterium]
MKFRPRGELPEAHFDLTPMVDVVLLLIIFFTLTAQFANVLKTPLELPAEKGAGKPDTSEKAVVVDLLADGELRLDARPIALMEFLQRMNHDIKSGEVELTVRADRACPAQHLNALASGLTQIGLRNWKLATASEGT